MLYLRNVLLRYILIYNLEVSFNCHLTFVQLNVIKMFTVQYKVILATKLVPKKLKLATKNFRLVASWRLNGKVNFNP